MLKTFKFIKSVILPYNLGSRPQKSPKIVQKRIAKSWFAQILHKNGIYCHTYSESSCPEGLEDVWQGGYRVSKAELWTAEVDPYLEWQKKGCGTKYIIGYFFLQKIRIFSWVYPKKKFHGFFVPHWFPDIDMYIGKLLAKNQMKFFHRDTLF